MFEGTLVESRGMAGTGTERWTALGSVTFQCALAGLLIAIPLLRPEVLPTFVEAPKLALPSPYRPPVVPVRVSAATVASTAPSLPVASPAPAGRSFTFTHTVGNPNNEAVPTIGPIQGMTGTGAGPLSSIGTGDVPNVVVARPRETGPSRISSGVSEGMLLTPIQPVYPAIAKAAGIHGAVVMEATISKEGRIEGLHVVSGPAMLRNAAMAAVQAARYRPYLLSGDPTEVQTTVTVIFNLGSQGS